MTKAEVITAIERLRWDETTYAAGRNLHNASIEKALAIVRELDDDVAPMNEARDQVAIAYDDGERAGYLEGLHSREDYLERDRL